MTTWTAQQEEALDAARRWIDAPVDSVSQVFRLFGYAGTGKSTIAHELRDHVGGAAVACAYTGKAASVMSRKGLPGAMTVHRAIYNPKGSDGKKVAELRNELKLLEELRLQDRSTLARIEALRETLRLQEKSDQQPSFVLKAWEESPVPEARLVILDECSMCPESMARDLLSFGTKVLCLGDPAQLPPVKGAGYFIDARPDRLLTEIHRQALDNPILRLATLAREGKSLPRGEFDRARVVGPGVVTKEEVLAVDQILAGTNAKRRAINHRHRVLEGYAERSPMPLAGEKVVCCRNDHDLGLMNGTIWDVVEDAEWSEGQDDVYLTIVPDTGGEPLGVRADAGTLLDEENKPRWGNGSQVFTWASAITVHRAQGSQFDDVLLFNDWPSNSSSYSNFLYTGITRAAERLTVVMP
jgi:exodeoxyribonuclease-5